MSHLPQETLWELGQPGMPMQPEAEAHLQGCEKCRTALDDVKFAQNLLVPVEVPALSEVSAKRIGDALFEAAAKQALQRPWWKVLWPFELSPAFGFAAAAAAALAVAVYFNRPVAPVGPGDTIVAMPGPSGDQQVPLVPVPAQPVVPTPPTRFASVTSARNATDSARTVKKLEQVAEGTTVATAKNGSLWMKLPDGSRAGLAAASQVKLSKLDDSAVALEVSGGSLVMVARHRPERVLTVRAGDLEVIDVGTRFLVSRDVRRVLVAVEEGSVEIRTPGKSRSLTAGHSVEYRDGRLTEQVWSQTSDEPRTLPAPVPPPVVEQTPDIPTGPQVEVEKVPPPPTPAPEPGSADEWATPQPKVEPGSPEGGPTASLQPAPNTDSVDDDADESFLKKVEKKLKRLRAGVAQGFPPAGMGMRETQAREVEKLADGGTCQEALKRAEAWLRSTPTGGDDVSWKRAVLRSQMKCFNELGKPGEAKKIETQLQQL